MDSAWSQAKSYALTFQQQNGHENIQNDALKAPDYGLLRDAELPAGLGVT